jgi:hypothetical protein
MSALDDNVELVTESVYQEFGEVRDLRRVEVTGA